ncbi:prolipoprotein diacylglyceryl transferase [Deltaproteobacteria bacterium TL4]
MKSSYLLWDVHPVAFQFGNLAIRWYGLSWTLALAVGYLLLWWLFKVEHKEQYLDEFVLFGIIGTFVGARLGHYLFYQPQVFIENPLQILKFWKQGGMASHGSGVGMMIAFGLYSQRHPQFSLLWLLDRGALVVPCAGAIIRMGNLLNSEIIGKPTEVPWAFIFTRVDLLPRHPTQIYEAIGYLTIFFIMRAYYLKRKGETPPGGLLGIFLTSVFVLRFVVEFFKESHSAFEQTLPLNMGQLLSLPLILLGMGILMRMASQQKKHSLTQSRKERGETQSDKVK